MEAEVLQSIKRIIDTDKNIEISDDMRVLITDGLKVLFIKHGALFCSIPLRDQTVDGVLKSAGHALFNIICVKNNEIQENNRVALNDNNTRNI